MNKEKNEIIYRAAVRRLYYCGIKSLLEVMDRSEKRGDYENCQVIKEVIEMHNKTVNDNLPTNLEDLKNFDLKTIDQHVSKMQ